VIARGNGISSATGEIADANIVQLARSVFGDYVVAFEVTSVLLVVAVVGTVLLSRRHATDVRPVTGRPS
jgi:NADH-quinone oxidoreductase subunit J